MPAPALSFNTPCSSCSPTPTPSPLYAAAAGAGADRAAAAGADVLEKETLHPCQAHAQEQVGRTTFP
eukprot:745882-Hanusia_phi.AAC.4